MLTEGFFRIGFFLENSENILGDVMEETELTCKLLSGAELKELNTKSDLAGGLQLGSHVAAILGLGYLHYLAMGSWWVLATGFALGVVVTFSMPHCTSCHTGLFSHTY